MKSPTLLPAASTKDVHLNSRTGVKKFLPYSFQHDVVKISHKNVNKRTGSYTALDLT